MVKLSDLKSGVTMDIDEAIRRMQVPALGAMSATDTLDAATKKHQADAMAWAETERPRKRVFGGAVGVADVHHQLARIDEAARMPHSAHSIADRFPDNIYAAGMSRDIQAIANRITGTAPGTIPGFHDRYIESIANSAAAVTRMADGPVVGIFGRYVESISASAMAADRHLKIFSALDEATRSVAINAMYVGVAGFDLSAEQRLLQAAGMMRSPWADAGNLDRSLGVLHNYLEIGRYVGSPDPYGDAATSFLRSRFGDWRDPGALAADSLLDRQARYDFYIDRGFDEDLTDAPDEVVEEEVAASGLSINWVAVFEVKEISIETSPMRALQNAAEARNYMGNFEIYLRDVINRVLTDTYGLDWHLSRVPKDMLGRWIAKRNREISRGRPEEPILNYSEFSDLGKIVCQENNFNEVFKKFIPRLEDAQEAFARLTPIRNVTAHNRLILPVDMVTMTAEVKRFVMATWSVLNG